MPDSLNINELHEIMAELPDSSGHEHERREHSLTKADVLLIYRIAKLASVTHECPFQGEETGTLHSVARNINATQKIATIIVVTGFVTTILSGLWFAIKHVATEWIHTGAVIK
jgi:hypothetical protein